MTHTCSERVHNTYVSNICTCVVACVHNLLKYVWQATAGYNRQPSFTVDMESYDTDGAVYPRQPQPVQEDNNHKQLQQQQQTTTSTTNTSNNNSQLPSGNTPFLRVRQFHVFAKEASLCFKVIKCGKSKTREWWMNSNLLVCNLPSSHALYSQGDRGVIDIIFNKSILNICVYILQPSYQSRINSLQRYLVSSCACVDPILPPNTEL